MDIFIYISDLSNFGIFAKFMRNILRPSYTQNSYKYLSVILEIFKISTAKKNVCNDGIFVLVVTFLTHSPPAALPAGRDAERLHHPLAHLRVGRYLSAGGLLLHRQPRQRHDWQTHISRHRHIRR